MRGDRARLSTAARLAANASATAARPWLTARVRIAISCKLLPGEGQPALQLGIEQMLVVQVDRAVQQRAGGADQDAVGPELGGRLLQQSNARSRSARQTLRPSITPSESIMPGGRQFQGRSNCSGARTRSRCTAATGSLSAAGRLSRKSPKYVARQTRIWSDAALSRA